MQISYDREADAVYVTLRDHKGHLRARKLGDGRFVHYDETDAIVGVEFLFVSQGIDLTGIPEAERIRELLESLGRLIPAA